MNSFVLLLLLSLVFGQACFGQIVLPHVRTPTAQSRNAAAINKVYPWHKNITATIFWIGEAPAGANKTPNYASSWDPDWSKNYGGYDNPDPSKRANYRPKAFRPKLNPFYVALPYNDLKNHKLHKKEASRVIPWFRAYNPRPGQSVCHGKWVQITYKGKVCFAQWEDCGPWTTDDYQYVFLNKKPKTKRNNGAGIDLSPAVRDALGIKSGEKCHWRFVPFNRIPKGPWSKYGSNNPFLNSSVNKERAARKGYFNRLKK